MLDLWNTVKSELRENVGFWLVVVAIVILLSSIEH